MRVIGLTKPKGAVKAKVCLQAEGRSLTGAVPPFPIILVCWE